VYRSIITPHHEMRFLAADQLTKWRFVLELA